MSDTPTYDAVAYKFLNSGMTEPEYIYELEAALKGMDSKLAERDNKIKGLEFQIASIAKQIHYPECWDTAAYPTLTHAIRESARCDPEQCTH